MLEQYIQDICWIVLDEELENMINVNFTSMVYTIRAFMPAMLEKNKRAYYLIFLLHLH